MAVPTQSVGTRSVHHVFGEFLKLSGFFVIIYSKGNHVYDEAYNPWTGNRRSPKPTFPDGAA
jgi:hypothetical protein